MKNIGKELDRIITEKGMVKKKLTVRDQARHSSLAITNIYAARRQKANSEVLDYRGSL